MGDSILDKIVALPKDVRAEYLSTLDDEMIMAIDRRDWMVISRPEQWWPDGDWFIWFMRAGRGGGKTKAGAEAVKQRVIELSPHVEDGKVRVALVAPTFADVRDVIVEGDSGLLKILPPSMLKNGSVDDSWNRSIGELKLENGSILHAYSSEKPRMLRGPQHHLAWVDEPAELRDAHLGTSEDTTWSNLMFGLRLPPDPRVVVTGTPKNNRLIREILSERGTVTTQWSTYQNLHNLSEQFLYNVVQRYEGTRLGRQELHADLLDDVGEMFQRAWFQLVDQPPPGEWVWTRYWDLAATEPNTMNPNPDWTVGTLLGFEPHQRLWYIRSIVRFRHTPGRRDNEIRRVAMEDGLAVTWVEQEKGSAGKSVTHSLGRHLDGVARVKGDPVSGSKQTRAELVAGAAEQGRLFVQRGEWVETFLDEAEEFPNGTYDDQIDSVSGGFKVLSVRGGAASASTVASMGRRTSGQRRTSRPTTRTVRAGVGRAY